VELFKLFEAFEALNPKQDSVERKNYVRDLQAQVKSGRLSLSEDQAHRYLASEFELTRILVYLMIENTKLNSDLGSRPQMLFPNGNC